MELKSITIKNYKSIKEITIPIDSYGGGDNRSSTTVLVGLNESGKSSILEAISYLKNGFDDINYSHLLHKDATTNEYIRISAKFVIENQSAYQKKLSEKLAISKEVAEKIEIKEVQRYIWHDKDRKGKYFSVIIESNIDYSNYLISDGYLLTIEQYKTSNDINKDINPQNIKTFLKEGEKSLTKYELEQLITTKLLNDFLTELPDVQFWRANPQYLINEPIDLDYFKNNIKSSIPLNNIFRIAKISDDIQIKNAISNAIKNIETKAELEDHLTNSITKHVNKVWKEHKISIKVRIDGTECSVYVEDRDRKNKYFTMQQRSDGFNHFISLILSLSTTNETKQLNNNIILLDEPETHLHPSGVRYMLNEILKIGYNNHVIVATHNHYMIDTAAPERHFIVSKEKMQTKIEQVDNNTSMADDQVLAKAFGINIFKELLPKNILVVEGNDDKIIFSHSLNKLQSGFNFSIKSAGGASKVYGIASLCANENIEVSILFDDDKEGIDAKNVIFNRLKEYYTNQNVFTVKDINNILLPNSTTEDLLPKEFVKEFFEAEMKQNFTLTNDNPFIHQLKNQNKDLQNNKDIMNSKKLKLAKEFVKKFPSKKSLEDGAPILVTFANNLIAKIQKSE